MLIDLHTHTFPKSDDSELRPGELVERAKRAGLDGICLTEHDYFWDPESVVKLSREHDFLIIPGVEINTEAGHLLVFGLSSYIFGMHKAPFVKELVDRAGGAMLLAHPYRRQPLNPEYSALSRAMNNPIYDLVDAVEELNGNAKPGERAFSLQLCRKLALRGIGGSDAHAPDDIPSCATYFPNRIQSLKDLIAELKAGRFQAMDLRRGR